MLIFCCFFFIKKFRASLLMESFHVRTLSRALSLSFGNWILMYFVYVSLSLFIYVGVCVSADTSVDVVVYNCCRDFVLGPSFPHRFIGQANFGFNFMKQFVDHLICLCWNQLQNRKKTHEFMIKTNFTHRTVIAALTDFTVVFINSFLCVRSKSGYFE